MLHRSESGTPAGAPHVSPSPRVNSTSSVARSTRLAGPAIVYETQSLIIKFAKRTANSRVPSGVFPFAIYRHQTDFNTTIIGNFLEVLMWSRPSRCYHAY
jgi:hypothetical protein